MFRSSWLLFLVVARSIDGSSMILSDVYIGYHYVLHVLDSEYIHTCI